MDRLTPEQRHRNMRAIKCKDTKIEIMLRKELWKRGLRYRKNTKRVFGHPDIAFIGKKIAIFCDSEFWHGYEWSQRKQEIKSNQEFWYSKIERNMTRDIEVNEYLSKHGWRVLRFWGKEVEKNCSYCADVIEDCYKKN